MAIAGSAMNSIRLWLWNGSLREGQQCMRGATVVESDVDAAIKALSTGATVNLELHGDNLLRVRRAFRRETSHD